ncbi:MAG: MG2 domain-containing protein [Pseudomonadota bacterium]
MLRFVVLFFGLILTAAAAPEQPHISVFTPQSTVKSVRQTSVRFSEPMVAFGDPRLTDPFDIMCPEKGTGRWADANNWVYDFDHDLPAGITCTFILKGGTKALNGKEVGGERVFRFNTGGPAITASVPRDGSSGIDAEQIFILVSDAPAKPATISRYARCEAKGINEQIPVRVIEGAEREKILAEQQSPKIRALLFDKRTNQFSLGYLRDRLSALKANAKRGKSDLIVVLGCNRRLPDDTEVKVVWGAGIESVSGIASNEAQTLTYQTRPAFTARFSCQRINVKAQCIPVLPMTVTFSASVPTDDAMKIRLRDAGGKLYAPTKSEEKTNVVSQVRFDGPFPEKTKFTVQMPPDLLDDAARNLANAAGFPLEVATDEYPPLAKFPADFGILEGKGNAVLPVTLRNLEAGEVAPKAREAVNKARATGIAGSVISVTSDEEILRWLSRFEVAKRDKWKTVGEHSVREDAGAKSIFTNEKEIKHIQVPKPLGEKAFEIVGIPLPQHAFHIVELASPRLGAALLDKDAPFYARTSVLVTNLVAHVKIGRESSAVWVTNLDNAQPVNGAAVVIRDCKGKILARGKTGADGVVRLPGITDERHCADSPEGYFVSARTAQDMTFTLTSWANGIEPWSFKVNYTRSKPQDPIHAVFDRTLLRAGETVHMKLIARKRTMSGFEIVPAVNLPKKITVEHGGSSTKHDVNVQFDERGIALIDWPIPKDAKLGEYGVSAQIGGKESDSIYMGTFRVEEFRLPTMRAQITGPTKPLVNPKEVPIDVMVAYLSGGGAAGLPAKLRTQLQPGNVSFSDYDDFHFYGDDVKEGIVRSGDDSSEYDQDESTGEDDSQTSGNAENRVAETTPLTLDRAGTVRHVISKLPRITKPQSIVAEVEYSDPNGERLTGANSIPLYPAAVHIGLRTDGWAASKEGVRFQALALDLAGKPIANRQIKVDMFTVQRYSHRRRLIGGFYAYEHIQETKRLGEACRGKTDAKGLLHCNTKTPISGEIVLRAASKDDAGNESASNTSVWVAGKDEWWFEVTDNDRMDVIPEAKRYEAGQKAKLQVRMPFRNATALVTVEREGVIDSFVVKLSGKSPLVEIPMKPNYAPNVFVSVLAVRGRVEGVKPTALVDLGKPAFKLGITEVKVGWQPHELKVAVSTPRETYKVREKIPVKVSVKRADGGPLPAGTDIAFAAVDQALLELKANDSWNLLDVMMQPRAMEVATSTAQMQVVGRRHFGRKALPPGGGGGRQNARELFDTLLLWKASVVLDGKGEAMLDVPLNDSLSAFKLAAIATGGTGLFGTGTVTVRTTQDVMLFGGLPPVVREGDDYRALFVARNTTTQKIPLTLNATLWSTNDDGKLVSKQAHLPILDATLGAGESRELAWDVKVPMDLDKLHWEVTATDVKGQVTDRLKLNQKVIPAYPVQVYQATLFQLDAPKTVDVQIPVDAIPGRGGISLAMQAKLAEDLSGVQEYMSSYPYTCLEQRSSIAVVSRDEAMWAKVMASLPDYLDRDGLAKYFASDWLHGSDVLTTYLLAIAEESSWEIPESAKNRMIAGLTGFVNGRVTRPSSLPTADLTIRKLAAIDALSRHGKADKELLASFTIAPNLWPTSAVLDWFNILKRVSDIPGRDSRIVEAQQILRSRLNFQGTIMTFSTQHQDALWWLMVSNDVNANRAVLALLNEAEWRPDLPRMARGALERRLRGHWDTTVANAWGTLAMEKFSNAFEAAPLSGATMATLAGQKAAYDWSNTEEKAHELNFAWPHGKDKLAITHQGAGKPWVTMTSHAAIPLKAPLSTGYRIERTVTPVERKVNGVWSRGDVARVKLSIEAQSDMTWVVVNDPIPTGAAILGSGLGRDSQLLTQNEKRSGYAWPAFEERKFDGFRAYYEYVPKGKWTVEYTLRLNNPGSFLLPSTRVEAMYAPEMFGEVPNQAIVVKP